MYKRLEPVFPATKECCVLRETACIPFDPANTDYQKFKKDVLEGAELHDADGNVMTQEEAVAFINELP